MQDRMQAPAVPIRQSQAAPRAATGQDLFALQRLAGNRATANLIRGVVVQRACGPDCECKACQREAPAADPPLMVQRATSGTFLTTVTPDDKQVSIAGTNAADWNTNAQNKLGGEGGKEEVSGGKLDTSVTDKGLIDGAEISWTVTKTVPTVDESGFTNNDEKNAAKALAARVDQHEESHKQNDLNGRKDWAKSLNGKKDADAGGLQDALECKIGKTQRALDNKEGLITLGSNNQVTVSGKDHPEYESTCKP